MFENIDDKKRVEIFFSFTGAMPCDEKISSRNTGQFREKKHSQHSFNHPVHSIEKTSCKIILI